MKINTPPANWKLITVFIATNLLNLFYLSGTNLSVMPKITFFAVGIVWSGAATYSFFVNAYNYTIIMSTVFLSFAIPNITLEQVEMERLVFNLLGTIVCATFTLLLVGTFLGLKIK